MNPELVKAFEDGTLNVKEFDHKKHVYIAYVYLGSMPKTDAIEKYCKHLKHILDTNGYGWKYNEVLTAHYINRLDAAMKENPTADLDELCKKM
jgi:hypothetical protein